MAAKKPVQKKQVGTSNAGSTPAKETPGTSFSLEDFLKKNSRIFLFVFAALGVLITLLIFDTKVSIAGDDSAYILRAHQLMTDGVYPNYQGPLYPIVLMLPLKIFGVNVVALKLVSTLFIGLFIVFFFLAFERFVPYIILIPLTFLMAINPYLLYYGTQTFNEAFFMMLMSLYLWLVLKAVFTDNNTLKENISLVHVVLLGFGLVLLGLTRFIAFAGLGGLLVFFIISKKYKESIVLVLSFILFYGLHTVISTKVFGAQSMGFETQLETVLRVDPYDVSQGKEDLSGFIVRIWDNTNLYISKTFFVTLGLRPEGSGILPFLSVFTILLAALGAFGAWMKHRANLMLLLFIGAIVLGSFILLQKFWDQDRLIQAYLPFILICLVAGLYSLGEYFKLGFAKYALSGFLVMLSFLSLGRAVTKINDNYVARQQYLSGNTLYGMSPDYINYLSLAKWSKDNLPEKSVMATRMATICWVYSGADFYGIYSVPTENADSLLMPLKAGGVTHVLDASIRINPSINTGQTISTVPRYMYYIEKTYPGTFRLIQEAGTDEKARLYEIKYPKTVK
jgi:hypothetical protein